MPDVKIKGYSAEFTHKDVPFVWLADPSQEIGEPVEGETPNLIPFTYGRAVPKTVAPDFSGGDMAVPIADGELVNQLTIAKPADLIPEHIPEGMYIAGVGPGTFAGGGSGGGSGLVIKSGTYIASTAGRHTIEHGLGITPDFVAVFAKAATTGKEFVYNCAMSNKLFALSGSPYIRFGYTVDGTTTFNSNEGSGIEMTSGIASIAFGSLGSGNEVSFTIGGIACKHVVDGEYVWIAIAI